MEANDQRGRQTGAPVQKSWGRLLMKRPPGLLSLRVTSKSRWISLGPAFRWNHRNRNPRNLFRLGIIQEMIRVFGINDYTRAADLAQTPLAPFTWVPLLAYPAA